MWWKLFPKVGCFMILFSMLIKAEARRGSEG
jgi:hypothetical protein